MSNPPTSSEDFPGDRPSYVMDIRAGNLMVDRRYQPMGRYDERRAERIAREWDWARYPPLQVGIYDDHSKWIIDGQHRWNAARIRFGDDIKLPCYIVGQVSVESAAKIFANADKNRVRLGANHKFGALLASGDEDALRMVAILASHGWNLVTDGSTASRSVACVATIDRLYRDARGGPQRLDQTMRVITQAWGYHPRASSAIAIGGVYRFLKLYGGESRFDEGHLIKRLHETSIEQLLGPLAGDIAVKLGKRVGDQNNLAVAYAIRNRYNFNRRSYLQIGVSHEE